MPARPVSPPGATPAMRMLVACAAVALALVDGASRLSAQAVSLPSSPDAIPAVGQLAQGAPYHTFSMLASDYYDFHVHWMLLPLLVLVVIAVRRSVLAFPRLPFRRLVGGLVPAVLFLVGLELLVLEAVPLPSRFVAHPTRFWSMRPDMPAHVAGVSPWTTAEGFRPTPTASEGAPTVLVIGDSTTFGTGLRAAEETYSWRLAEILRGRLGSTPRVINRGVPGYTSWQGLSVLREALPASRPRVVVASFMANDWTWSEQPDATFDLLGPLGRLRADLRSRNTYLYLERCLVPSRRATSSDAPAPALPGGARVSPTDFEANLEAMRGLCREAGVPLVFISLPMAPALDERSAPYRASMKRVAAHEGAELLNLYDEWKARGRNLFFFKTDDPIHPTEAGHQEIARALAERVYPLLSAH